MPSAVEAILAAALLRVDAVVKRQFERRGLERGLERLSEQLLAAQTAAQLVEGAEVPAPVALLFILVSGERLFY